MTILKRIIGIAFFSTLITTNLYPIIGGLVETAGRTATGAVDLAADTATGTVRAVTEPKLLPGERVEKHEQPYQAETQLIDDQDGDEETTEYRREEMRPRYMQQKARAIHK